MNVMVARNDVLCNFHITLWSVSNKFEMLNSLLIFPENFNPTRFLIDGQK